MTERVQRAIDIFLDSLNDGTLIAGSCTACAVGNLVAAACGIKLSVRGGFVTPDNYQVMTPHGSVFFTAWNNLFLTTGLNGQTRNDLSDFPELDQKQFQALVDTTGFTIDELAEIEYTFETVARHQGVIHALEAVVKVMMKFDEVDSSVIKKVFTDKAEAIYA
jgi:hypothetical protein